MEHDYYTLRQCIFDFSYTLDPEERRLLERFLRLLHRAGIEEIVERTAESGPGRSGHNKYDMMATVLFAFSDDRATLRSMEANCRFDERYVYLMQGDRPTYKCFCDFINAYFSPFCDEVLGRMAKAVCSEMGVSPSCLFVDGSKFEANANKYKFVWKPDRRKENLDLKAKAFLADRGLAGGIDPRTPLTSALLAGKLTELSSRDPAPERGVKALGDMMQTMLRYEEDEAICGPGRKSYFKTEREATAMCSKEDYYSGLGSNMRAAYNVQIGVSLGLILVVFVSQDRTDMPAFVPTLERYMAMYGKYPDECCADAGYGCLESYAFMERNGIGNYVKYQDWEGNATGKRPAPYSLDEGGMMTCLGGRTAFPYAGDDAPHPKKAGMTVYRITGCARCAYKYYCKRFQRTYSGNGKWVFVSKDLYRYQEEAKSNLSSVRGIELRVNRSIEVEGAFGIIKQDMSYERFRRKGLAGTTAEFCLVAIGYDIRRFFDFCRSGKAPRYWKAPPGLVPRPFPRMNGKRLSGWREKGKFMHRRSAKAKRAAAGKRRRDRERAEAVESLMEKEGDKEKKKIV